MNTTVITYEIDVAYTFDSDDLPNLSMLTTRTLKKAIAEALEVMRQENSLGTAEVTASWIEMK